ncbi:unnamed protein product [Sphagnum troendelagicum]|uniref:Origin of replication complex subunit 4 n=1 Tax=Sphagnum troendelagicum TaxID=128251 RepID=A0ABP0TLI7_9BRYO
MAESVEHGYNNSVLLLGPRGSGKSMILEQVLAHLELQFEDRVSPVRLNGLLHADDRCALKEIAKQLCMDHHLVFSKTASFDENLKFLITMLKECALSHKTVIFVLDEFDLFAQRAKQRLLYNLLDAMQSNLTQAAVVGLSCRLDADQLLEKRVRSRFSNRKLLFLPLSFEDVFLLLHHVLMLPVDGSFMHCAYARYFNENTVKFLKQENMVELIRQFTALDLSPRRVVDLVFRALCNLDRAQGVLSFANFKAASNSLQRQPKLEALQNASVLELYLLVSMKRLEGKEQETNFNAIYKEYEHLQEAHQTSDHYSRQVSLRAFEHLLERELIVFYDGRGRGNTSEFRAVELLISNHELQEGLKSNSVCPVTLQQWFLHEAFK